MNSSVLHGENKLHCIFFRGLYIVYFVFSGTKIHSYIHTYIFYLTKQVTNMEAKADVDLLYLKII